MKEPLIPIEITLPNKKKFKEFRCRKVLGDGMECQSYTFHLYENEDREFIVRCRRCGAEVDVSQKEPQSEEVT